MIFVAYILFNRKILTSRVILKFIFGFTLIFRWFVIKTNFQHTNYVKGHVMLWHIMLRNVMPRLGISSHTHSATPREVRQRHVLFIILYRVTKCTLRHIYIFISCRYLVTKVTQVSVMWRDATFQYVATVD